MERVGKCKFNLMTNPSLSILIGFDKYQPLELLSGHSWEYTNYRPNKENENSLTLSTKAVLKFPTILMRPNTTPPELNMVT